MDNLRKLLKSECVFCASQGKLKRYAGRFDWLNASICSRCATRKAEPLAILFLEIATEGVPEACEPEACSWVSFGDGKYLAWPEICAIYRRSVDDWLAALEDTFGTEFVELLPAWRIICKH